MRRPIASDFIKHESQHYQRTSIHQGLIRCGYIAGAPVQENPEPDDVLLLWNRYEVYEKYAQRYEQAGAKVIVVENGYIGADPDGRQLYAMALWDHSGAGEWKVGDEDRWSRLNVEVKPWQTGGKEIVVLPQRGMGRQGVAMPRSWPQDVVYRLRQVTDRPVRIRPHPGANRECPLYDLTDTWAAVTWASGAGIKAIVGGVPVFCERSNWIGAPAAGKGIDNIEDRFLGDRMPMLRRLSYAQWTIDEIKRGEPFEWLLK